MDKDKKTKLADRIEIGNKPPIWLGVLLLPVTLAGIHLAPSQCFWSIGFFVLISGLFLLRMETWKKASVNLELLIFAGSNIIWVGTLVYLYFTQKLSLGVALQIIGSGAFAVVLMRSIYTDKVNKIAQDLRKIN